MRTSRVEQGRIGQISVEPHPEGAVAVYLVESADGRDGMLIQWLLDELSDYVDRTQLSRGRLLSYAVQTVNGRADVLDEIERVLKEHYPFVVVQRTFDSVIYKVVKDLCAETGSRLMPIPHCDICGRPEPFPDTVITLNDDRGNKLASRCYCRTCTASTMARTNKDYVISLLSVDRRRFGLLRSSELIRSRNKARKLCYRVNAAR